MFLKAIPALLSHLIVYVIAFEDFIYAYGQVSQDIVDQGRTQYQLLQERGNLPRYGSCWKSAIEHVDEGCRALSEDTQSDMALHLTNCFLDMSGHETYNCEYDKKPNLKAICIRSMSDRAFNVYMEFYTHTQNICWFLRGQVWQETISENTLRVGKQLQKSAKNQEEIIESQKESLVLQEKLLRYGQNLEKLMENFYVSTQQHQEILLIMSKSLGGLQAWLVGEISWFDLIVFYVAAAILIGVFTSATRTAAARIPILFLLLLNVIVEHLIYAAFASTTENEMHLVQNEIYGYIWWSRKVFVGLAVSIIIYKAFTYRNMMQVNNTLLRKIYTQNVEILETIQNNNHHSISNGKINYTDESNSLKKSFNGLPNTSYRTINYEEKKEKTFERTVHTNGLVHAPYDKTIKTPEYSLSFDSSRKSVTPKEKVPFNKLISGRQRANTFLELQSRSSYNLRSRQSTPDVNV